jgi:hypothetical protein
MRLLVVFRSPDDRLLRACRAKSLIESVSIWGQIVFQDWPQLAVSDSLSGFRAED